MGGVMGGIMGCVGGMVDGKVGGKVAAGQRAQARRQPAGSAAFKHGPVGRPVAGATPTGAVKVASQAWGIAGRIGWQPRQAGGAVVGCGAVRCETG